MTDKVDTGGHVNASWGMWKDASGSFDGMYVNTPGITRRDLAAMMAMQGILSNAMSMKSISEAIVAAGDEPTAWAISGAIYTASYHHADGLIAEGRKGEE